MSGRPVRSIRAGPANPPAANIRSRVVRSAGGDGAAGNAPESPRILIVEDDYLVGMELEAGLTEAGFRVVGIANSADEAVRLATAERPALAIMDIRLAGRRDGVDAALEIFRRAGIRSIFATAHSDAEMRARARPAAPIGWLSKPYSVDALVILIRRALDELRRS